jgi:hypothetical protein
MRGYRDTLALCLIAGALSAPGTALCADGPPLLLERSVRAPASRIYMLPFPRSERAQSVWASGACWTDCQSYCAWGQSSCLRVDSQGQCLAYTDACDRYCQKSCRLSGGPLLNITD